MYRATTPTHAFRFPDAADSYHVIEVTYKQKGKEILTKVYEDETLPSGMTFDENVMYIKLTQEETNLFENGFADVQVRVMTDGADVFASSHKSFEVVSVNSDEVLEWSHK